MKRSKLFFSWTATLISIPILIFLAINQFNWLQELQFRERKRIERTMFESLSQVTNRVREEFLFLPSLMRFDIGDTKDFEQAVLQRWEFWNFYAVEPLIVESMYFLQNREPFAHKWNGTGFVKTDIPNSSFNTIRFSETKDFFQFSINITENQETSILVILFNKQIFFYNLLPIISEQILSNDSFIYRIIDTRSNSTIWQNQSYSEINKKNNLFIPDVELQFNENFPIPDFQPAPRFLPTFNDLEENTFSFIKERGRTIKEPERNIFFSSLLSSLKLQIANKDASLMNLSKKATTQNAFVSFGSVLLLFLIIIMLTDIASKAKKLAENQQEFIATITHELRSPLAVISSAAQNMQDGIITTPEQSIAYGDVIRSSCNRLGTSIEHYLLYSNTASLAHIKKEKISIQTLIKNSLVSTEAERQAQGFRTDIIMPEQHLYIHVDQFAIEAALQNLIQNVLKHASSGKYLGISVLENKDERKKIENTVVIKIRDKGNGIHPKEAKYIFDPFSRGKYAIENQIPGNGIGLNLAKRIIHIHGGSIKIDTKVRQGSTFIITLPCE